MRVNLLLDQFIKSYLTGYHLKMSYVINPKFMNLYKHFATMKTKY